MSWCFLISCSHYSWARSRKNKRGFDMWLAAKIYLCNFFHRFYPLFHVWSESKRLFNFFCLPNLFKDCDYFFYWFASSWFWSFCNYSMLISHFITFLATSSGGFELGLICCVFLSGNLVFGWRQFSSCSKFKIIGQFFKIF